MKKLIFLILFTLPILLQAQFGGKDCHTDLVFGFDIGSDFIIPSTQDRLAIYKEEDKPIYSFRIGTNLNYPIAERVQLVTGFRIADKVLKTYNAPLINHEAYTEKILHDFFFEVPFRARYIFGSTKKKNLFYFEGGLDANIYLASLAKDSIEKAFGRADYYNPISLSINLAPGFEIKSNRSDNSFFIQPIARFQVTSKQTNLPFGFYNIGIETGIRF